LQFWVACCLAVSLIIWAPVTVTELSAAEPTASPGNSGSATSPSAQTTPTINPGPRFSVSDFLIEGSLQLNTNLTMPVLSRHTGPNVSLEEIVQAATDLESVYAEQGYTNANIVIAPQRIANGVVTLTVFRGAFPQIVVAGRRYPGLTNGNEFAAFSAQAEAVIPAPAPVVPAAPALVRHSGPPPPVIPATPEEMARAREELLKKMAEIATAAADTRVHVPVSTNNAKTFPVEHYLIMGNTVLSPAAIARTMTNIDGNFGTNVSLEGIRTTVIELQRAYNDRGYVTVSVGLPPQKLTNDTVKIAVTEGRLVSIEVKGNYYYSSNNVMRALPSLHTNMILNGKVFQAELNQANANQDRQIYPVIAPGPDPGSSALTLKVKDRLPLHAKVEYNNQSSPGTPDLRLNSSVEYNNLWDMEHSLGLQYGFSPGYYKTGDQWKFYDTPLVANYGGFYRMPLGPPQAIAQEVANNPGVFGYDEATRKFNLPPASGQPELNLFASRATIDTGQVLDSSSVVSSTTNISILQDKLHQDLTVDNDLGFRLSAPLIAMGDFSSDVSAQLDFKTFQTTSTQTTTTTVVETNLNAAGQPVLPPLTSKDTSVNASDNLIQYLPLTANLNANWRRGLSAISLGMGVTVNPWFSGTTSNLQAMTSSTESSGYWVTLNPRFSWSFPDFPNWMMTVRADGQWANQPLISNEKYGAGGVDSVRGYHEGEVFGDTGWHVTVQQDSPDHLVGIAFRNLPLTVRGSTYMDYARVFSLDPQNEGTPPGTSLWDVGVGGVFSLGTHYEARFLFSLPLLGTTFTPAYEPYFNFNLTAQF